MIRGENHLAIFSDRLKQARKKRGLTQEELGNVIQQKKTTISNYETGYSAPANKVIVDLADALDVTTDYLLGRTESPTKYKSDTHQLMQDLIQLNTDDFTLIQSLVHRLNQKK